MFILIYDMDPNSDHVIPAVETYENINHVDHRIRELESDGLDYKLFHGKRIGIERKLNVYEV